MIAILRNLARYVYRHLLPRDAKNCLRLWMMFDERHKPAEVIRSFPERRVMVLAPHMDDEVVACGGTLRKHVLTGAKVTIVFLTDGRAGDPTLRDRNLTATQRRRAEEALSQRRKQESRQAANILGYDDLVFLDRPDGDLTTDVDTKQRIGLLLEQRQPQLIYLPCPLELHPDHWVASRLFAQVVAEGGPEFVPDIVCRAYEAWTPLLPNRLVDITDVFDLKMQALQQFASQLEHVDYVRTTSGLNAFRSVTQDGRGFVEAFYEGTAAQHAQLIQRYDQGQ